MRLCWIPFCVLAGSSLQAQTLTSGFADLSFGGLFGDAGTLDGGRLSAETQWALGPVGLQIGASLAGFGSENSAAAFRAILTRDLQRPVRLGLSIAYETNDGVKDDTVTFGFHGLYRSDWTDLEANLLLPNHIRETGTFSFNIAGEQWLTRDMSIKTDFYRLSTDTEDPDYYSISLQLNHAVNDTLTIFAQGFQTVSDDYDIKGEGTHIGMAYQVTPALQVVATLDQLRPQVGDASTGLTLALRYDFGGPRDDGQMFQTAISPDRFYFGAFEPAS